MPAYYIFLFKSSKKKYLTAVKLKTYLTLHNILSTTKAGGFTILICCRYTGHSKEHTMLRVHMKLNENMCPEILIAIRNLYLNTFPTADTMTAMFISIQICGNSHISHALGHVML